MDPRAACEDRAELVELDATEAKALFDRMARKHMDMGGDEFLRRLDAGEFDNLDEADAPGIVDLWNAVPLVR